MESCALSAAGVVRFEPDLVRKYDGFGPRYTSYPTADRFTDAFTKDDYANALRARSGAATKLSLYVHVPFCSTICFYCACNKVVTKNRAHAARYVDYVLREIAMVASQVSGTRAVTQLHWGGGTPTFLSREEMAKLMGALRAAFDFEADAEVSIEVDPRTVDEDGIAHLASLGFNRLSLGIQDFDPAVQKAVNRIQGEAATRALMDAARRHRFVSINADLIYGLPKQTVEGFAATLDKVIAAGPDRIAIYSYAHLPHLFKPQRRIVDDELPAPAVKLDILGLAIARLGAAGYVHIGMDHFAKPGDELAVAQRERKLHRNFQGYSTRPDTDLLAFGVSAIGKVGDAYAQNAKTLADYYAKLDTGELPVMRGVTLDADDVIRREVIQRIMCDFDVDLAAVGRKYAIDAARYFAPELESLAPLTADGLVETSQSGLRVTPSGRLLVRNVAMTFDRRLREAKAGQRYSRVI